MIKDKIKKLTGKATTYQPSNLLQLIYNKTKLFIFTGYYFFRLRKHYTLSEIIRLPYIKGKV